jgi:hypothetical protein
MLTVKRNIENKFLRPGCRDKVWLISCEIAPMAGNSEDTISRHNITCQMLALLEKFGPEHLDSKVRALPSPTSIFPCDCSTTSTAISEMAWRLKRASYLLDDAEQDDIARSLESLFLCSGVIVVTHPETLNARDQDILLAGLEQYSKSSSRSECSCPIVAVLLPSKGNRFSDLMQSMNEVTKLRSHDVIGISNSEGPSHKVQKFSSLVNVVFLNLCNMSRGIRPSGVPENAYRIRLGTDSSIADIVSSMRRQDSHDCICFDFGGDASEIAQSPIAPALVSLMLTGVIGQSQHAAEVICSNLKIYFEFSASSKAALCQQFPILSSLTWLDDRKFACGDPPERAQNLKGEDSCLLFEKLADRAKENGDVKDCEVQDALYRLFKEKDRKAHNTQGLSTMPFIHTRQSLHIMGRIAQEHTLRQVSSEIEDTHGNNVQAWTPILLSGDTGTGKTYLLFKYLELLRSSGAVERLSNHVSIYTLSAKYRRSNVENMGSDMRDTIQALVFATCNPDPIRDSVFRLMSEVKNVCINMDPLSPEESNRFIQCQLQDDKRGPQFEGPMLDDAMKMLKISRDCFELSIPRVGTTSLRDAVRCASLSRFLDKEFYYSNDVEGYISIFDALEKDDKVKERLMDDGGWAVQGQIRALCLACYLCFGMRIIQRSSFFDALERECGRPVKKFIDQVKSAIVDSLLLPSAVVRTSALEDNLFAGVIAVAARLPLLCLGCDGTSKTLSLNLLLSRMQGKLSGSPLLQGLARVQTFHLQLSERSVAKNVTDLKTTVVQWKSDKMASSIPCIFMEEMSMAEAGPTGKQSCRRPVVFDLTS